LIFTSEELPDGEDIEDAEETVISTLSWGKFLLLKDQRAPTSPISYMPVYENCEKPLPVKNWLRVN
jgi:hypothetical protein